jgi:hypothetical protein
MRVLHGCTLASTFALLVLLLSPHVAAARTNTMGERVVTSELVATNVARNQFRLVGHNGWFTAPPGTSVEALDGKPVQVEFGHDGHVLDISLAHTPIDRITHSMEIVTGQLIVQDPVLRTFSLAGGNRVYVAPPDIDVRPYGGQRVRMHLDEHGRATVIELAAQHGNVPVGSLCVYDGQSYSEGASTCQFGTQFRCESGAWQSLGVACATISGPPCSADGVRYASGATHCAERREWRCESGQWRDLGTACVAPGARPGECIIGGASVADGSAVCRKGTTFRCDDGSWVNVGTACS